MISDREDADAYDAALSRLLDGLDVPEATDSAEAAANAAAADDVAKIARALRMIGAEAAGEPAVAGSAAADVAATGAGVGVGMTAGSGVDARLVPSRPAPLRAVPVPAPELVDDAPVVLAWWRKPSARVLTAAASVAVIALGVAVGQGAGSNGDSGAVAQQAPAAAADAGAAAGAMAPNEESNVQALRNGARAAEGEYSGGGAAADTGAAAADAAAAATTDTAATAAEPATATAKAAKAAAKKVPFAASTVKCARAIVVGEVTSVGAAKVAPRATWTFAVSEWVSPSSGASSATYVVGDRKARMPDGKLRTLAPGTSGLFLVPADRSDVLYAWTGDDVADGRKKIDAALAKGSSASC